MTVATVISMGGENGVCIGMTVITGRIRCINDKAFCHMIGSSMTKEIRTLSCMTHITAVLTSSSCARMTCSKTDQSYWRCGFKMTSAAAIGCMNASKQIAI